MPEKLLLGSVLLLAAACDPEASADSSPLNDEAASSRVVQRDIRDLITAVTPASPTLPPIEKNAWFGRRKETLERLRQAGAEHGAEALRLYHERAESLPEIRVGLLDVAAHTTPEETRSILVELVSEY